MAGGWTWWSLKVLSNPNHSIILWFSSSEECDICPGWRCRSTRLPKAAWQHMGHFSLWCLGSISPVPLLLPQSLYLQLSPSWRVLAVFLTVDYIQLLEPENMLSERPLWPCLISRSFSVGLYVCKLQGVADAFKISHSVRGAELWLQNVMFCVGWAERRRLQILKSHQLKHLHLKVNYDMQPLCSLVLVSVACP